MFITHFRYKKAELLLRSYKLLGNAVKICYGMCWLDLVPINFFCGRKQFPV